MAYIGKQPTVGNFVKLDAITTSATTTFNLLNGGVAYSPQSANHCIVSLNGVIQSPNTSFTISGSTIVFASALTASDVIDFILILGDTLNVGVPSDATVTNAKLALTAGSASAPTISIAADTNTGMFFPAADTIAFTEGGAEAMRINSSGFVGIGTDSIESLLDVRGANKTVSSQYGLLNIYSTDAFAIDKGGSITFGGRYATDGSFNQFAGIAGRKENSGDGSWSGYLQFVTGTTPTERMRIDSSGDVGIGTSVALSSSRLSVNKINNPCIGVQRGGTDGQIIVFGRASDGTLVGNITTTSSSTAYNTSSDYRLKENVNYNFDATTRLKQLKPARFNFIEEPNKTVDGFLAHEVQDIIPEAITGTKDETETKEKVVVNANGRVIAENIEQADWEAGKIPNEEGKSQYPVDSTWEETKEVPVYQGIDQSKLTPILTKALQEAIAKIESLEARLTALESK